MLSKTKISAKAAEAFGLTYDTYNHKYKVETNNII